MMNQEFLNQCLDRVEKIEMAGATSTPDGDNLAAVKVLRDAIAMIRREPPLAYVRLMKLALEPKNAGNRAALFGRLSGYALMMAMQSDDLFTRVMDINARPS
jgi:hypothetical protein